MTGKHAICSPSGASGWMTCPAWSSDSTGSKFAREGSAAHALAERTLTEQNVAMAYLGEEIIIDDETFTVDVEMASNVQKYVDLVRSIPGELFVEQKLPLESITGEKDAEGTSDAVIILHDQLFVVDLKYGMGVRVDAEENKQLMIYALAAMEKFSEKYKIKHVHMIISQPRLNHISEWDCTAQYLCEFALKVKPAAAKKLAGSIEMHPSVDGCRWCSKKSNCSALLMYSMNLIADDFDAPADKVDVKPDDELDEIYPKLALAEMWIEAVRAKIEQRLLDGHQFNSVKLVAGKLGNRRWSDDRRAEQLMRELDLEDEEMYSFDVLSPPKMEKMLKQKPEAWEALKLLVVQPEGKPIIADISDKRPAISEDFS